MTSNVIIDRYWTHKYTNRYQTMPHLMNDVYGSMLSNITTGITIKNCDISWRRV